ncbi:MAG: hypothetical protein WC846_04855 [Candidatus Gracilibacteria bacterium]|jgi:hypothetical protein
MKKILFLLPLLLAACQHESVPMDSAVEDTVEDVDQNEEVQTEDAGQVSQVFKSEHGDFDYTLSWSPKLLTLVDSNYEGATANAPSFDITGGGHISLLTAWIDSPGYQMASFVNDNYYKGYSDWPTSEPVPSDAGTLYPVYYFDWTGDSSCMIKYGVVKGLNEALSVRLEDCDGNDMKSSEAFGDLLSDLQMNLSTAQLLQWD